MLNRFENALPAFDETFLNSPRATLIKFKFSDSCSRSVRGAAEARAHCWRCSLI